MRTLAAALTAAFLLWGKPIVALADQAPACKSPEWVKHMMYAPPDPIAISDKALSFVQLGNVMASGPQPAPDDLKDPKAKITAIAYLFPAGQVTIAFFINGCAKHRLDTDIQQFLLWIQGVGQNSQGS